MDPKVKELFDKRLILDRKLIAGLFKNQKIFNQELRQLFLYIDLLRASDIAQKSDLLNLASDKLFEVRNQVPPNRITKDLDYMSSFLGSNRYESYLINDYLKKETIPVEHKVFIPKFLGIKVNID